MLFGRKPQEEAPPGGATDHSDGLSEDGGALPEGPPPVAFVPAPGSEGAGSEGGEVEATLSDAADSQTHPPSHARSSSKSHRTISFDITHGFNPHMPRLKERPQSAKKPEDSGQRSEGSPTETTDKPGRKWFFGNRNNATVLPLPQGMAATALNGIDDKFESADSDSESDKPSAADPKWDHAKPENAASSSSAVARKKALFLRWVAMTRGRGTSETPGGAGEWPDPAAFRDPDAEPDSDEDFDFVAFHTVREAVEGSEVPLASLQMPPPRKLWFRRSVPMLPLPADVQPNGPTNVVHPMRFEPPVGQLYVTVIEGRGIQAKQPYVVCCVQGQVQRTPTLTGSFPEWATEMAFNLHDVQTDVHFAVYDQPLVRSASCIGRIVVPLASLFTPSLLAPCGALAEPQAFWYELYPPRRIKFQDDELASKFLPGIRNIKGSGMPKPKKPLGFLRLQFQVMMCESLARLLFVPRWQSPGTENGPPIQRVLMKNNFLRCKKAFSLPCVLKILLEDNRVLFIIPFLFYWGCFVAKAWQIPPTCLLGLMVGGAVSSIQQRELYESITIWEDDVEMEIEEGYVLQKYAQRVQDFQNVVGIWATAMERVSNLFNWSDVWATGVAYAVLGTIAAALSTLLVILPTNYVFFLLGTTGYAFAVHFHRKRLARNKGRDRKLMEKLTLPKNPLGYFLGRVPDNMELTHRYISYSARVSREGVIPEPPEDKPSRFGFKPKAKPSVKDKQRKEGSSSHSTKDDGSEEGEKAKQKVTPTSESGTKEKEEMGDKGREKEKTKERDKENEKDAEKDKAKDRPLSLTAGTSPSKVLPDLSTPHSAP